MKFINNIYFRVLVLSLLIIAMILILRDNPTRMQYWISFCICTASLGIINFDVFRSVRNKNKELKNKN